jgi:predicted ATP-grasp superfamily ATP-dependent carboligase
MRAEQPCRYDRSTPVLILKMRDLPLHHGTLGVIRSFGRAGVPVYCSRETGASPAARSRYLAQERIGVLSPAEPARAVAQLKAFQSHVGRPMVVIPIDDEGALFLAENADALRPHFLLPRQHKDVPRMAGSKANTPQICAASAVATPETFIVRTTEDLAAAGSAVSYPAVMKVAEPWLLPAGMRRMMLAQGQDDVAQYWSRLHAQSSASIVIQEYIPDEQAEDWFYHGCHREGGEPVVGFTGRKLRSYPPFFGATSYGVSVVNEDVAAMSQRLLRELGYAGIVELEFRFDKRDRRYKVIDFNARLGAQFQFLRNEAGVDVVRALHLELTGRKVPDAPQAEGVMFLSDFTDAAAFAAYWRRGAPSAGAWLGQAFRADEHAWYARDDIWPFIAAFGQFSLQFGRAAGRRIGGRRAPA